MENKLLQLKLFQLKKIKTILENHIQINWNDDMLFISCSGDLSKTEMTFDLILELLKKWNVDAVLCLNNMNVILNSQMTFEDMKKQYNFQVNTENKRMAKEKCENLLEIEKMKSFLFQLRQFENSFLFQRMEYQGLIPLNFNQKVFKKIYTQYQKENLKYYLPLDESLNKTKVKK